MLAMVTLAEEQTGYAVCCFALTYRLLALHSVTSIFQVAD